MKQEDLLDELKERREKRKTWLRVLTLLLIVVLFFVHNIHFYGSAEHIERLIIDESKCSQLLDKGYYVACYDYDLKGSRAVLVNLERDKLMKSIKKRPRFYEEELIPAAYRSEPKDYNHSGYDRGHMASDASFDYSEDSLHSVYSMVNIVPQDHLLNSHYWARVEQYSRQKAKEYGALKVLNLIVYSQEPKRIGEDGLAVPSAFYKILWNKERYYQECFYYENESTGSDDVRKHKVACKDIEKRILDHPGLFSVSTS